MMLHFATLYWISAMNCLISSILLGMTRVICKKYDAVKIWDWIKEYNVRIFDKEKTNLNIDFN